VIEVNDFTKRYADTIAVDAVSFDVSQSEIFVIVGPNGAGKTTTIECLQGARRADEGHIRVLDMDPAKQRMALAERVGIQFQESRLWARIRVIEALELFASFYRNPVDWSALLVPLGLEEKRKATYSQLSGGQKQRLFVGLALVGDPELLFLDEVTTGLDPHARRAMWGLIQGLRDRGKTIVMSTHFMEEAEHLADRVAVMDRGRIVALDAPATLVARMREQDAQGPHAGTLSLEHVFLELTGRPRES
jgi:ABC-2 type transport system ATP-binding protein